MSAALIIKFLTPVCQRIEIRYMAVSQNGWPRLVKTPAEAFVFQRTEASVLKAFAHVCVLMQVESLPHWQTWLLCPVWSNGIKCRQSLKLPRHQTRRLKRLSESFWRLQAAVSDNGWSDYTALYTPWGRQLLPECQCRKDYSPCCSYAEFRDCIPTGLRRG